MATKTTIASPKAIGINSVARSNGPQANHTQGLTTQVKATNPRSARRKFTRAEKLKIVEGFDACTDVLARNEFLRKQGLYYAGITKWRKELRDKNSTQVNAKTHKLIVINNQIKRENETLKKKLAQAEAIIDLQKKVSELLSTHVLHPKTNEAQ